MGQTATNIRPVAALDQAVAIEHGWMVLSPARSRRTTT
jgi:hypothetical protein